MKYCLNRLLRNVYKNGSMGIGMSKKVVYFFAYFALFVAFLFVLQNINSTGNVVVTREPIRSENSYFSIVLDDVVVSGNTAKISYNLEDFSGKSGSYQVVIYDPSGIILVKQEVVLEGNGNGEYAISFDKQGYDKIVLAVSNGYFSDELTTSLQNGSGVTGNVVSGTVGSKISLFVLVVLIFGLMIYLIRIAVKRHHKQQLRHYERKLIPLKLD